MMAKQRLSIGLLIFALLLYQAPNLALLAYHAGFPLVEPGGIGLNVTVRNGWYPLATNVSVIGRISIPEDAPQMITFHRPSILWPWKADVFAVITMKDKIDPKRIESTQVYKWGAASLLRSVSSDPIRLHAVPDARAGVLTTRPDTLQDIEVLAAAK